MRRQAGRLLHMMAMCLSWRGCVGGQDASAKPQPPEGVPERTLTFESYYRDPSFRPHIPVYVTEVDVASYIPDKIVSIRDRVELSPLPDRVRLVRVYRRPRQIEDVWGEGWEELVGESAGLFELSVQQGRVVLLVNMSSASATYAPLGATGSVNHFDPIEKDGVVPFPATVSAERQKTVYREEGARQQAARAEREAAAGKVDSDIYARVPGLLGINKAVKSSLTDVEYDALVAGLPPRPLLLSSEYIFDYTLLLQVTSTSNNMVTSVTRRLDVTIVPRVARQRPTSVLCSPTNPNTVSPGLKSGLPFELRGALAFNMLPGPESAACQRHGRQSGVGVDTGCARSMLWEDEENHELDGRPVRKLPRVSSSSYVKLHPEEAFWLEYRLDRTSEHIAAMILDKLGRRMEASEARLAVAVAHGGEGKRGAVFNMGVANALWKLGIYQGASWVGASSGATWFLSAWYASCKAKQNFTGPPDLPATKNVEYLRGLARSGVPDEFDANEAMTDYLRDSPPLGRKIPREGDGGATNTDRVLCDAELKLNAYHALEGIQGTPSLFEYVNRALAMEFLDPISGDAMAWTLSGLAKGSFLQKTAAPLPIFQLREDLPDHDDDAWGGRLWSATPFDLSVYRHSELHASFPTERLDSNVTSSSQLVTQFQDTLPFIAGLSSNPLPGLRTQEWARPLCGGEGQEGCSPVKIHNPFKKFEAVKSNAADPTLYDRDYVYISGGGGLQSLPVWPFVNPARRADIVIVSDASGGRKSGLVSRDTTLPRPASTSGKGSSALPRRRAMSGGVSGNVGGSSAGGGGEKPECLADALGRDCPGPILGEDSVLPGTLCCDYCRGPEAAAMGCWPSDAPDAHALFGLSSYSEKHSLPLLPRTREQALSVLDRVTFFGCDSVTSRTAIVYVPNRVIVSGASGHPPLKGVFSYHVPGLSEQRYGVKDLRNVYDNGMQSLPNLPHLPAFDKCLACLYYASAVGDDQFMKQDEECSKCWEAYCYQE